MKLLSAVIVLASASAALAGNGASYPKDNAVGFVVQKLDITTLPSAIRPKRDKQKRTFGDYGYVAETVSEKEIVEKTATGSRMNIRILEQQPSGIYVCVTSPGQDAAGGQVQRVLLLKMKNSAALLKTKASWKEFDACPMIGGLTFDPPANYD